MFDKQIKMGRTFKQESHPFKKSLRVNRKINDLRWLTIDKLSRKESTLLLMSVGGDFPTDLHRDRSPPLTKLHVCIA